MNKILLKSKGGKTIAELPAYESLYQVPLSRYIDFLKAREPLDLTIAELGNIEKEEEKREAFEAKALNIPRIFAQSVGAFFGLDLDTMLKSEFGNYEELKAESTGIVTARLSSLNMWIINLLGTFSPKIRTAEDCNFEYKGERYSIPVIGVQTLASLPLLPDLETGEMIEAYEIKRLAQAKIEKNDPEGSHLFSYYLRLLAVLCRKEGEQFPVFESDVERFINERSMHFREIDAGTALDVDFFLAGSMRPYEQTGAAVGFLSNRVFDLVHQHANRKRLNRKRSIGRWKDREKSLRKSVTGKRISSSLKGLGLQKPGKAQSKA